MATPQISEAFIDSPWYAYIIFVLLNLQAPPGLSRTKGRFLKMKSMKYCIIDNDLFWKDNGGILLSCLLKDEANKVSCRRLWRTPTLAKQLLIRF